MPTAAIAYLMMSVVMGLLQVADCIWLYRSQGRIWSPLVVAFSLLEYGWAAISFLVWWQRIAAIPFWLPAAFFIYVVALGTAGILVSPPKLDRDEFAIPRSLVFAGGAFGAGFFLASAWAIIRRIN